MQYQAVNLQHKFGLFNDKWQPKVVAEMNDYQFKIVKIDGDFVWHHHEHTDETFIVIEGTLRMQALSRRGRGYRDTRGRFFT
jgi:mannose-6-phosphate isomerase-like protein (cupin superfamily)